MAANRIFKRIAGPFRGQDRSYRVAHIRKFNETAVIEHKSVDDKQCLAVFHRLGIFHQDGLHHTRLVGLDLI